MREAFDKGFAPPAPVLPLLVGRPQGQVAVAVRALVDTGADLSVLPAGMPEQLGLPVTGSVRIASVDGRSATCEVFAASVRVGSRTVVTEVVGLGAEALAGRELLRHFVLRLDGPAGVLEIVG